MAEGTFLKTTGNYRSLRAYRVSECIYDITYYFAHKFLGRTDRTIDQMVQAARSGKQNIAEGSAAAMGSTETEIKLTNVAKASLQELLIDYEDYLRVRGLCQWPANDARTLKARRVCAAHLDSAYYREAIQVRSDETIANIAIVLIHQCDFLLRRLLEAQQRKFLAEGGVREKMFNARRGRRGGWQTAQSSSDKSDKSDKSEGAKEGADKSEESD